MSLSRFHGRPSRNSNERLDAVSRSEWCARFSRAPSLTSPWYAASWTLFSRSAPHESYEKTFPLGPPIPTNNRLNSRTKRRIRETTLSSHDHIFCLLFLLLFLIRSAPVSFFREIDMKERKTPTHQLNLSNYFKEFKSASVYPRQLCNPLLLIETSSSNSRVLRIYWKKFSSPIYQTLQLHLTFQFQKFFTFLLRFVKFVKKNKIFHLPDVIFTRWMPISELFYFRFFLFWLQVLRYWG